MSIKSQAQETAINHDHKKSYFVLPNGSSWWAFEGDGSNMMGTFHESHSRKETWMSSSKDTIKAVAVLIETSEIKSNKWWPMTIIS